LLSQIVKARQAFQMPTQAFHLYFVRVPSYVVASQRFNNASKFCFFFHYLASCGYKIAALIMLLPEGGLTTDI
jgi:hypothetical protein